MFHPAPPEDFREFWDHIFEETRRVRLHFSRTPTDVLSPTGHRVDTIAFNSVNGVQLSGWIAYEPDVRRAPSFVWIPPYGRESLLPNTYGTRAGYTSLSLNLHGLGAFHQETYRKERGYFAEGAESPETWVFRTLIQHVLVAVNILQAQSEADEDRIGVMGMSQGGGMAIWAGAVSPVIKAVCADMPFFGAAEWALSQNAYRYPLKELVDFMGEIPIGRERVLHTASYFDTMNLATLCDKPTLVTLGLKDPACRPEQVRAIYEALPGKKQLIEYPGGHDWDPDMVDHNRSWLNENLTSLT